VDKKLDELNIDKRFRNIGASKAALKIMKMKDRGSLWRRPAAIKHELGEYENLNSQLYKSVVCGAGNEVRAILKTEDSQKAQIINTVTRDIMYDLNKPVEIRELDPPLDLTGLLEVKPEVQHYTKPLLVKHSVPDCSNQRNSVNTVALRCNTQDNSTCIYKGDNLEDGRNKEMAEVSSDLRSQFFYPQQQFQGYNPHANIIRMLLS